MKTFYNKYLKYHKKYFRLLNKLQIAGANVSDNKPINLTIAINEATKIVEEQEKLSKETEMSNIPKEPEVATDTETPKEVDTPKEPETPKPQNPKTPFLSIYTLKICYQLANIGNYTMTQKEKLMFQE